MYKHNILKWSDGCFIPAESDSTEYYSLKSAPNYGDVLYEEFVDSLDELYLLWKAYMDGDAKSGELGYYELFKHTVVIEDGKCPVDNAVQGYIKNIEDSLEFVEF